MPFMVKQLKVTTSSNKNKTSTQSVIVLFRCVIVFLFVRDAVL